MSYPEIDDLPTQRSLVWRKLHLSRAKLKASGKTSALLSGFAMVAMVEIDIDAHNLSPAILVSFVIVTTLLVVVHMLALMISTCILPNLDTICALEAINFAEESPHEKLHWYIETAWAFSTLLGLILFLVEIGILCWMKFPGTPAWSATIILIPVLLVFLGFAAHFYISLVTHKYEVTLSGLKKLEDLQKKIDHDIPFKHSKYELSELEVV